MILDWIYLAGLVLAPVPFAKSIQRFTLDDREPDGFERVIFGLLGVVLSIAWPVWLAAAALYGASRLAWSVLRPADRAPSSPLREKAPPRTTP